MLNPPDEIRERVLVFLADHDLRETPKQDFLDTRFDAGPAWVHYPDRTQRAGSVALAPAGCGRGDRGTALSGCGLDGLGDLVPAVQRARRVL